MPWFELTGDQRITERCATADCGGQVTHRLEAGGIGSNYCPGCKHKIDLIIWRLDSMGWPRDDIGGKPYAIVDAALREFLDRREPGRPRRGKS